MFGAHGYFESQPQESQAWHSQEPYPQRAPPLRFTGSQSGPHPFTPASGGGQTGGSGGGQTAPGWSPAPVNRGVPQWEARAPHTWRPAPPAEPSYAARYAAAPPLRKPAASLPAEGAASAFAALNTAAVDARLVAIEETCAALRREVATVGSVLGLMAAAQRQEADSAAAALQGVQAALAALLDHQQTACLRTDQAAAQHSSPAPTRAPLPSAAPSRRRPRPRRRSSSGSEAGEEAERGAATSEAPPVPPVSDDPWACLEAPPVQTLQPVQAVRRVPVILPALQEKGSTGGGWRQLKRGREAREE